MKDYLALSDKRYCYIVNRRIKEKIRPHKHLILITLRTCTMYLTENKKMCLTYGYNMTDNID